MALGYLTQEQVSDFTAAVLAVLGPVMTVVSMAWSFYSKTDEAIVSRAIALPNVERIETKPTPEGRKLAESVPDPKCRGN
jgi:hypothetical protein